MNDSDNRSHSINEFKPKRQINKDNYTGKENGKKSFLLKFFTYLCTDMGILKKLGIIIFNTLRNGILNFFCRLSSCAGSRASFSNTDKYARFIGTVIFYFCAAKAAG